MVNFAPLSRGWPGTKDIRVSLNWEMHINDYYPFALVDITTQSCFRLPSSDSPSSSPMLPHIRSRQGEPVLHMGPCVRRCIPSIYSSRQNWTILHSGEVYYYDLLIEAKVHQANLYHQPSTTCSPRKPCAISLSRQTPAAIIYLSQLTRQKPNTLPSTARVQTSDI